LAGVGQAFRAAAKYLHEALEETDIDDIDFRIPEVFGTSYTRPKESEKGRG
jgi:hypothetical protein